MTKYIKLPNDVLKHIITFMIDDIDIISISFVSKLLFNLISNNDFWIDRNKNYHYVSFNIYNRIKRFTQIYANIKNIIKCGYPLENNKIKLSYADIVENAKKIIPSQYTLCSNETININSIKQDQCKYEFNENEFVNTYLYDLYDYYT